MSERVWVNSFPHNAFPPAKLMNGFEKSKRFGINSLANEMPQWSGEEWPWFPDDVLRA